MSKHPEISAIVLAGGQGRRMGGQDKGLIELAGRPLIELTLERIAPQTDEVLISANRHLERYARLGHRVVADEQAEYLGPMAGIYAAGQAAQGEWLLVVPCDAPFLPHDLAQHLLAAAQDTGTRLVRAADAEQTHYTTLLMHRSLLPSLGQHLSEGKLKLQAWQASHAPETVRFEADPAAFLNVNTPEDLQRAEALAARSPHA